MIRRPPATLTLLIAAGLAIVGGFADAHRQNREMLGRQSDTVLWRSWFVCEMQRHDRVLHLTPLPWPGPLDLPPEPAAAPSTRPATRP